MIMSATLTSIKVVDKKQIKRMSQIYSEFIRLGRLECCPRVIEPLNFSLEYNRII